MNILELLMWPVEFLQTSVEMAIWQFVVMVSFIIVPIAKWIDRAFLNEWLDETFPRKEEATK